MAELNISEYQISLWETRLETEQIVGSNETLTALKEQKLCDLGTDKSQLPSDAINPKLTLKNNGEIKFEFELYTSYWDPIEGQIIENPLLQFINAERRVKLHFHDEWYDFVITELNRNNKKKLLRITCDNAFSTELGKTGYGIEFSTDLENNLDSVFNLAAATVENSDWRILDNQGKIVSSDEYSGVIPTDIDNAKSDIIQEIQNEYLYAAVLTRPITAAHFFDDKIYEGKMGDTIYIFSSCLNTGEKPYTFLTLTDDEVAKYSESNELILNTDVWRITSNYKIDEQPDENGWYLPYTIITGSKAYIIQSQFVSLQTSLRARRFISGELIQYDNLVDKYTNLYKFVGGTGKTYPSNWTQGCEIRGYTEVEYLNTNFHRNLISNSSNFLTSNGWINIITGTQTESYRNDEPAICALETTHPVTGDKLAIGALKVKFKTTSSCFFNNGLADSKNYLSNGLSLNEKFVLKVKVYDDTKFESNCPIRCFLHAYTLENKQYKLLDNPILDFRSQSSWNLGNEYAILNSPSTYSGEIYTLDESSGQYVPINRISMPAGFDPNTTYYYKSDQFFYLIASIQHGSYSYDALFNDSSKSYGFFIESSVADINYYIKDFEVFRYINKPNSIVPYLPEENVPPQALTKYYYYKKDPSWSTSAEIEYYITESADEGLIQKYNELCEKCRSISTSKSNRYNILSLICENFECWMRFHIARDENGKILTEYRAVYEQLTNAEAEEVNKLSSGRGVYYNYNKETGLYESFNADLSRIIPLSNEDKIIANKSNQGTYLYENPDKTSQQKYLSFVVTESNHMWENVQFYVDRPGLNLNINNYRKKIVKAQRKYITFHSSIGNPLQIGFIYGLNLDEITRTVKSESIVTKLLVEENHNEYTKYGYCSIADGSSNPSGESYIYNFNHYINKKLLNGDELVKDLNYLNKDLKKYNNSITIATDKYSEASNQTTNLLGQASVYKAAVEETSSEISSQRKALKSLSLHDYEYWNNNEKRKKSLLEGNNTAAISVFRDLQRLEAALSSYQISYDLYYTSYISWLEKQTKLAKNLNDYTVAKKNRLYQFELKYANYIREGTWSSEDYDNAEIYYLDACNTSENAAYPKVTYSLKVVDLSGIEEYSNYRFDIGDRTYIQDEEMFGYYSDGITPLRKDVAITEIVYNLTKPSESSITIATFKDEFNDLFERFAAATQKLEYNEAAYDQSASAISTTLGIDPDVLQQTVTSNNLVLGTSGEQGVEIDSSGIKLTSVSTPNNIVRLVGQGIFLSSDGGSSWISGLTANGFNTSIFKSGVIYVNKLNILDNNSKSVFGWNADGITAYDVINPNTDNSEVNMAKFVRFDRYGIYGYWHKGALNPQAFSPTSESDILNNSSIPFSLTWSGFQIRTYHKEWQGKTELLGGGIRITSDDDFSVFDVNNVRRIKIGCLQESSGSQHALYGMQLKNNADKPMLYANDDGTFWLSDVMYVGGVDQSSSRAEFGASHEHFSGWVYGLENQPLYPIETSSEYNSFQRILRVNEKPAIDTILKASVSQTFNAHPTKNPSQTRTLYAGTTIYLVQSCLINQVNNIAFYILTDEEFSAILADDKHIDSSYTQYTVSVLFTEAKYGVYYIPYLNGSPIIKDIKTYNDVTCAYYRYGYKFEIYDDGTVRSPKFCIDENGNVFLNYDTKTTLVAPILKATNGIDLTQMTIKNWGLRIDSMETGSPSLRLAMGVTQSGSVAINPYIYFIPNESQAETSDVKTEAERLKRRGLVKMFNNDFMWMGNAVLKDSASFVYADNGNRGLLLSFGGLDGENGGNPTAYIVNGNTKVEIATRNATAVFG